MNLTISGYFVFYAISKIYEKIYVFGFGVLVFHCVFQQDGDGVCITRVYPCALMIFVGVHVDILQSDTLTLINVAWNRNFCIMSL